MSPCDGDEISPAPGDPYNFRCPIIGKVTGLDDYELEDKRVHVIIHTDRPYYQGNIEVQEGGFWSFEEAKFGGKMHIVRAILKDNDNHEIASTDITVRVQR